MFIHCSYQDLGVWSPVLGGYLIRHPAGDSLGRLSRDTPHCLRYIPHTIQQSSYNILWALTSGKVLWNDKNLNVSYLYVYILLLVDNERNMKHTKLPEAICVYCQSWQLLPLGPCCHTSAACSCRWHHSVGTLSHTCTHTQQSGDTLSQGNTDTQYFTVLHNPEFVIIHKNNLKYVAIRYTQITDYFLI